MRVKAETSIWSSQLIPLVAALSSAQRQLRTLPDDPFEAMKQIGVARDDLRGAGVETARVIDLILSDLDGECVKHQAEFWGRLEAACVTNGWELHGSTDRRLVNRALFVSISGPVVKIEGQPSTYTPYIPSLIAPLARWLQGLGGFDRAAIESFTGTLAKSYDSLPRPGVECSLEDVYRRCVIEMQKPIFWRNPTPTSFVTFSRPAFRYRLSEMLRLGISTADGRILRLGTTTMTKDAWEIFSPGEQRVILAGRISLSSNGDGHAG